MAPTNLIVLDLLTLEYGYHSCEAEGFKSLKEGVAEAALFASVQKYFESASFDPQDKVRCTDLPPIYFQHRGHSLTIVGLERRTSGSLKLLVFDPMFHDPEGVVRLVGRTTAAYHEGLSARDADRYHKVRHRIIHRNPDGALRLYRRGNNYLKKYREFELLRYVLVLELILSTFTLLLFLPPFLVTESYTWVANLMYLSPD